MTQSNEKTNAEDEINKWPPDKKAEAALWVGLVEKRIKRMQEQMPPKVFQEVMLALDTLLMAWDYAGRR